MKLLLLVVSMVVALLVVGYDGSMIGMIGSTIRFLAYNLRNSQTDNRCGPTSESGRQIIDGVSLH